MIRKRRLIIIVFLSFFVFLLFTVHFMKVLLKTENEVRSTNSINIDEKIRVILRQLPAHYKIRKKGDNISDIFLNNIRNTHADVKIKELWNLANSWVSNTQLYELGSPELGTVLNALRVTKIIKADLDVRGTQLKLLLTLEGKQQVVFKPKWYEKDSVIEGPVYAGKDRYGAEILAFYLSAILNQPLVPLSVERTISLRNDVHTVATRKLLQTSFSKNNLSCTYGSCYYCKMSDPICDNKEQKLTGAVIFNIKTNFKNHRSPWQRTYKKEKFALWEMKDDYCKLVKSKLSKKRLYELVDTSIFDFLMQNGDRHHYEVLEDNVMWIDNGKGLGNPNVHYIDILAPLYQCCIIRRKTWNRLQQLSGGLLKEKLELMPDVSNFVSEDHLKAIEERLLLIYATVEFCKTRNKVWNDVL